MRALRVLGPSSADLSVGFTGFIGRGGELIDVDNDDRGHEYLARRLHTTVLGLEEDGLVRFDLDDVGYMGVSFVRPLTPAQTRRILSFADHIDSGGEAAVDVNIRVQGDSVVTHLVFSDRVESPSKGRLAGILRRANAAAEAAQ